MTTSTLSETDTGVYVDRTGDIVLVFTDTDGEKKSLILQENAGKNFGRLAHTDDGYYEWDYAPYTPVRLSLPNIKRPDQPTYNIEEIERNEDNNGAWIGDQGTIIIHRSDGNPPDRTLHIMFDYDTHYELKFVMPAASNDAHMPDHTPDTFHDKLDDIQKQIDQLKEQVSNAISIAQTTEATTDIIASRVSTLEEENKPTSNASDTPDSESFWRDTPDSEGFWRDIEDDVWVRDHTGYVRLIARGHRLYDDDHDIYNQSYNFGTEGCGPFTKIDNPFLKREDHAE